VAAAAVMRASHRAARVTAAPAAALRSLLRKVRDTNAFNQWWELVTMYLRFYPKTVDRQNITWVETLLMDTTLA